MSNDKIQECIRIDKDNINIIGKALEEYWSKQYHNGYTISQINITRMRVRKIKEQMKKIGQLKICWG